MGDDLCRGASYKRHAENDIAIFGWWWLGWRRLRTRNRRAGGGLDGKQEQGGELDDITGGRK